MATILGTQKAALRVRDKTYELYAALKELHRVNPDIIVDISYRHNRDLMIINEKVNCSLTKVTRY